MTRFSVVDLPLAGLKRIERRRLSDERVFLARVFCAKELAAAGWSGPVAQVNHTCTAARGTVRGLHFQNPPYAEIKLVSCIRGEVWDVAVDIRAGSKTLLRWHAERLSADNGHAVLIPRGFAHGFQALTDDVELLYCHSAAYSAAAEAALNPRDPMLAISWPLHVGALSSRDARHPMLGEGFTGIAL